VKLFIHCITAALLGLCSLTVAAQDKGAAPAAKAKAKAEAPVATPLAPPPVLEKAAPALPAGSTAAPGWNNPPKWDEVSTQPQYASVPGRETNVLIQDAGRHWRELRNGPVTFYGGIVILVIPAIILLFYLSKGQIKLHDKPTGRLIERFNSAERVAHWTMAISFVVLAISGVVMLFGKYILLPVLGYGVFATITVICKNLHNFVGPLFIFSLVVMFVLYVKDNFFASHDGQWFASFGGLFSGKHVPSGRFNGGEKAWFWGGLVLLGLIVSVSGMVLLFPNWNTSREVMGQANLIHAVFTCLFIAASFAHIYLGTLGMEGAYKGMREGFVDETWAKEHHEIWYNEVKDGKRPEKLSGAPQAGAPAPAGDD
jgi:formate dehydrogenase subunit gamma